MSDKFLDPSKNKPEDIAAQLRKPTGDNGIAIGKEMNDGNAHICKNAYDLIGIKANDKILEIGMGNGLFVEEFISKATNTSYIGLDFSATMVTEATKNNALLIESGQAEFVEASIEKIPFDDNTFDSILTVNTLYFWPNPEDNTKELLRVLKPNGKLLIGFRDKETLDKISITQFGFTKYEIEEVEQLLSKSGFKIEQTYCKNEPDIDFGEAVLKMKGYFTIATK